MEEDKEKKKLNIGEFLLDIMLVFIVIGVLIIVIIIYPTQFLIIFQSSFTITLNQLVSIIPIFLVATFLAGIMDVWIEKEMVVKLFDKTKLIRGLFYITCLGIITPGPIMAMFPIVLILKRKGVKSHFLIAFIAGQTMMGPLRIPLELLYLGAPFLLVRTVLAIFSGITSGLITLPFSNWLDKDLAKKI
ncbi:MAG: permease [Candidatus Helarchaeota archaeon]